MSRVGRFFLACTGAFGAACPSAARCAATGASSSFVTTLSPRAVLADRLGPSENASSSSIRSPATAEPAEVAATAASSGGISTTGTAAHRRFCIERTISEKMAAGARC